MRSAIIILACVIGGLATVLLPMSDVSAISNNLIVAFTILAGLLAQMIALTAVIFEPTRMSSDSVRQVGSEVRGLQTLNIVLFGIYLIVLALFVIVDRLVLHPHILEIGWREFKLENLIRCLLGGFVTLAIIRTFRTLFAIRTLQDLRIKMQTADAEAREKNARDQSATRLQPVPDQAGAAYGDFIDSSGRKKKLGKH